jgi:hemolysin D
MTLNIEKLKEKIRDIIYSFNKRFILRIGKLFSDFALEQEKRSDQEFLPAAISILETPPSPINIGMLRVICAFVSFALLWAFLGHIDILAIAQGKVQPSGRVKTIQPIDSGRVTLINVHNGQHVNAGEALIQLDPAEAIADERTSSTSYLAFKGEVLRRRTSLQGAKTLSIEELPKIDWPDFIPRPIRDREDRVLKGDLEQIRSSVQSIEAQVAQKEREEKKLESQINSQEMLIETLKQRVAMRKGLLARGSTSKAAVIDATETLQTQETGLAGQKGQLEETKAAINVLMKDKVKTINSFIAENQQKISEAEREADELEQKTAKAHVKTDHTTLTAPIAGVVLGLAVTTKNQVIQSGEEIMRIVPDDAALEIEAYVENKDIGFVKVGQEAIIKVESFPFTRFGTLNAVVTHVSHDAIPEPDATNSEGMPAKSKKDAFLGGAQRTQNLVFQILLKANRDYMAVQDTKIPLSPGMAVTAEIKTGKRRIIDYVFSPLVEITSRAMKER